MEQNYNFSESNAKEIRRIKFNVRDMLATRTYVSSIIDEKTGEVKRVAKKAFGDPRLTLKLIRTKKDEDLLVLNAEYTNLATGYIVEQSWFSRNEPTVEDLKALWPAYRAEMSREQVFALKPVVCDNAICQIGIFAKLDADGNPAVDVDGEPIVLTSVKALSFAIAGKEFEPSGAKHEYVESKQSDDASEQADDEQSDDEQKGE